MTLDTAQRKKVEENVGLVHKVITDKVHGPYSSGIYSREDLFQIGCIGLCKAAVTDKGGCFSTYAYRLIWNEICDELIRSSRVWSREMTVEAVPDTVSENTERHPELRLLINDVFVESGKAAPVSTQKGLTALRLMADGYTSREIGEQMGASANVRSEEHTS